MSPITVQLSVPITIKNQSVDRLTFRPATLRDLIAAEKEESPLLKLAVTLAGMSGLTVEEFSEVVAVDIEKIAVEVREFMGNSEAASTGEGAQA